MSSKQIEEFLREKAGTASPGIDWTAKRDAWIKAVEDLYGMISNQYLGLESAAVKDIVTVDRTRVKSMQEPHIGKYSIPELILTVGGEQVFFSPKGVNVVGAEGRVDVRGDRGEAILVRQSGDHWSLVISRTPKLQLLPLDEGSFLGMLRIVML